MAYNFNEMSQEEISQILAEPEKLSELSAEELLSLKSFVKDDLSLQADLDKRIAAKQQPQSKTETQREEPNAAREDEFSFGQSEAEAEQEEKALEQLEKEPEPQEALEDFDQEYNIDKLTPEQLNTNRETVKKFADFNPFELNEQGELVHPEFADEYKALNGLQITNDQGAPVSEEKSEKIKNLMVETAKTETMAQAMTSPKFMTPEEYIAKLKGNIQKGIVVSSFGSEFNGKTPAEISKKDIADKFNQAIADMGQKPLSAGEKNIFAYISVVNGEINKIKDRLANKFKETPAVQNVGKQLDKLDKKAEKVMGPKTWGWIKRRGKALAKRGVSIATYAAVGYATGGVGLAVLAAKSGIEMYNSMQKKAQAENISLKEYAKKNPWETTLAASQTVLSAAGAVVGLGALGEHAAQTVSPVLKTAGRVLAVGPKLIKTAVKFSKLQLIKRGVIKGDAEKTKKEASEALNQTIDATVGIFLGETAHNFTGHASPQEETPQETQQQTGSQIESGEQSVNYAEELKKLGVDSQIIDNIENNEAALAKMYHDRVEELGDLAKEETPAEKTEEILSEDQKFWDNRADKFLGEEATEQLYKRIESGEIKLPEGIENKQEFAYKLAMAFEQTPAFVAEDLGIPFQQAVSMENSLDKLTPEQFEKLGGLMNDFSDRGNYTGERPLPAPHNNSHTSGNDAKTGDEALDTPKTEAENGKTAESDNEQTEKKTEEIRDEEYYKDMQGLKELQNYLQTARQDPNYSVEQTLDAYLKLQTENGALTEQQASELGNYMKQELDLQNKPNGDDDISKKDIKNAVKETEKTTEAMEQNAEEVLLAKNVTYPPRNDLPEQLPESYSHDTETSKFYQGLSDLMKDMHNQTQHGAQPQDIMKEAIVGGRISEEQATLANTRYAELRAEGKDFDRTIRTMEDDFKHHAGYYQAQENAQTETKSNANAGAEKQQASAPQSKTLDSTAKHEQTAETTVGNQQTRIMSGDELQAYLAEEVKSGTITKEEALVFAQNYIKQHGHEMPANESRPVAGKTQQVHITSSRGRD